MITPFFITGLPRTRSAWLANWLTTDTTLCYHDVVFKPELLQPVRRVGFSGSELIWQFQEIHRNYPQAPWLHVMRDPKACLASWINTAGEKLPFQTPEFSSIWQRRLDAFGSINCDAVKRVSFEDLDNVAVARVIWDHLIGTPFDSDRWNVLVEFNIQQKFDLVMQRRKEKQWPS